MELVIVGFHRSGTSLLAQLLHTAGLFVGDDLLGALPSNPYGHFEDREVLDIHRDIMQDHGVGWQVSGATAFHIDALYWERMSNFVAKRRAAHPVWGFKDPRVCFFLGAWKYLLPDARFVVVYRDPSECARSLEARHAREYFEGSGSADDHLRFFREHDHSLRMWVAYNRAVVDFVQAHIDDCLVIPYSHLPSGYPVVEKVNKKFGSSLAQVATEAVFDSAATSTRQSPLWVHNSEVAQAVDRTWRDLEDLARQTGSLL